MTVDQKTRSDNFRLLSSIAADVWQPAPEPSSYQCWYFDAVSDDGRDVITITFLDNFIFSPRYNSLNRETGGASEQRFPALAFFYYRNGKPLYASVCEYAESDFIADAEIPSARIGTNTFHFESAPYGEGYSLQLNITLKNGRRIKANLEWLVVEGNLSPKIPDGGSFLWNVVAPRCDVTGKIEVYRTTGKIRDVLQFRGTGYHDKRSSGRWSPNAIEKWQWGRAHFADVTAVFCNYLEPGAKELTTKLAIASADTLSEKIAYSEEKVFSRTAYGMRYPQRLTFYAKDNLRLRLKQTQMIDSSFFFLRFLSEAVLTVGDGTPRKTIAVTEFLMPNALRHRWLDWLVDLRIQRLS